MILRPLAALLLAFIALGPGGSAAADPPPATGPLAGIPNLDVQYYEVSGQSVAEIRASLNRVRPRDPNDGLAVDAVNRWYISWRWPRDGSGGCLLARTELRFTATLRMPRLAGPTPLWSRTRRAISATHTTIWAPSSARSAPALAPAPPPPARPRSGSSPAGTSTMTASPATASPRARISPDQTLVAAQQSRYVAGNIFSKSRVTRR